MRNSQLFLLTLFLSAILISADANRIRNAKVGSAIESEWNAWKMTYKKSYGSQEEEDRRFAIWSEIRDKIMRHNAKYEAGKLTYSLGLNQFSDQNDEEFALRFNRKQTKPPKKHSVNRLSLNLQELERKLEGRDLPKEMDWRDFGVINPVKDQGLCGSCYSFATICTIESHYAIKTSHLLNLSEQQIVDCAIDEGDDACSGGLMDYSYDYVLIRGIMESKDYPYKAKNGICLDDKHPSAVHIHSYVDLPLDDEYALKLSVALLGPVAVAIDAENDFRHYKKGVFNSTICDDDPGYLDHAITVIGYGTDRITGQDYWLVRNSWSASWGEKGYVRMARTKPANLCGIADSASFPLL